MYINCLLNMCKISAEFSPAALETARANQTKGLGSALCSSWPQPGVPGNGDVLSLPDVGQLGALGYLASNSFFFSCLVSYCPVQMPP